MYVRNVHCVTRTFLPKWCSRLKRLIVDSVGCALGGYASEPAKIARAMAATVTSSEPATVIGSGARSSIDMATFANGVMLRFLDFNDGYTSKGESGHPSDSIAAVLTVADALGRSGKEAITATVLAYEVFCRICDEVDLKPLGFDHVTVGGMASTAAAARLFGLKGQDLTQAFNLGIAPNVALYQTRIGHVSMWKGCAYANASRNAVFAAMLATRGMTGPTPIFEGVGGYFKAVTRAPFTLATLGGRDIPYKILECSIKRFPLGQYSQTVVEAALELRAKDRERRRHRRDSHRNGHRRGAFNGRRSGEMDAGDARNGGSQHALYGGDRADLRQGGVATFR